MDDKIKETLAIPALESFDKFFRDHPKTNNFNRMRGVIASLATRDGFRGIYTLGHLVTHGTSQGCEKVNEVWERIPNCGEKTLELIDSWLSFLGLHRGMKVE